MHFSSGCILAALTLTANAIPAASPQDQPANGAPTAQDLSYFRISLPGWKNGDISNTLGSWRILDSVAKSTLECQYLSAEPKKFECANGNTTWSYGFDTNLGSAVLKLEHYVRYEKYMTAAATTSDGPAYRLRSATVNIDTTTPNEEFSVVVKSAVTEAVADRDKHSFDYAEGVGPAI